MATLTTLCTDLTTADHIDLSQKTPIDLSQKTPSDTVAGANDVPAVLTAPTQISPDNPDKDYVVGDSVQVHPNPLP